MHHGLAVALAAGLLAAAPSASRAQPPESRIDEATEAFEAGDPDAAEALLAGTDPRDPDGLFLRGRIAASRGRWEEAARAYRAIVEEYPELPRARLELARALDELGETSAAEFQLRTALARGDLPPEVIANVNLYLQALRERKRLFAEISVGVLPDSNANRSSALKRIDVFGLPFILSEEARQKSAVGVSASASGEYVQPIGDGATRIRAGAAFYRIEYPGGSFDDMAVQPYVGPQFLFGRGEASLVAFVTKRWYANETYQEGAGLRVEGGWTASENDRFDGQVQVARLRHPARDFLDGWQLDLAGSYTRALSSSTFARATLGGGHQETEETPYQNDYGRLALGLGADIGWGVSVYAEPSAAHYAYAGQTFGIDRRDWLVSATVTATKRDWDLLGFWPQITSGYERNLSTVDLYAYDRVYALIGLVRQF